MSGEKACKEETEVLGEYIKKDKLFGVLF